MFITKLRSFSPILLGHFKKLDQRCEKLIKENGYCEFDSHFDHLRQVDKEGIVVCRNLDIFSHVFVNEPDRLLPDDGCGISNVDLRVVDSHSLRIEDFPFLVRLNHENETKSMN